MGRFVSEFTRWHADHHTLARVLGYELRALRADHQGEISEKRRQFDRCVDRELRGGIKATVFKQRDVPSTRRAILSLGIDVARCYGPTAHDRPSSVGELYADLVIQMLT